MKIYPFFTTTALVGLAGFVALAAMDRVDAAPDSQELTGANYREWMKYIRPTEDESQWQKISWRNKLMPAVEEARRLNRPVLLWAMNGNPCGET